MYSWIALVPCPIPIIFNSLGNRRECRFRHPLLHHQIRQIGAHLPLLRGGVLLQVVGHGDVQQGIVLCLLPPSVAGAEVGEGDDLAAEEDFHAVVELAESAGGEPEEFRKDCGADDRSLFGFYQGDGEVRAEGEQLLSELRTGTGIASNPLALDAVLYFAHFSYYLISTRALFWPIPGWNYWPTLVRNTSLSDPVTISCEQ